MGLRGKSEKTSKAIFDDSKAFTESSKHTRKAKPAKTAPSKATAKVGTATRKDDEQSSDSSIPFQLQQKCLNIFQHALWSGPDDVAAIQEVKGHLYNRDFAKAFGSDPYLRAYALRWSAARAIGYLQVFESIWSHMLKLAVLRTGKDPLQVLALGAGAGAEFVALAGFLDVETDDVELDISLELVDIANWQPVVRLLEDTLRASLFKPPTVVAAEASTDRAQGTFTMNSVQADILAWDEATIKSKASTAHLTTLMFTLNELYSASVPKTQRLLHGLTAAIAPGSLLLVVDSPGSYSTVSINGAEKKYPMQWLLDHTMLATKDRPAAWEKVASDGSKWFRLPEGLQYPIKLENMRYQLHLYRRLKT